MSVIVTVFIVPAGFFLLLTGNGQSSGKEARYNIHGARQMGSRFSLYGGVRIGSSGLSSRPILAEPLFRCENDFAFGASEVDFPEFPATNNRARRRILLVRRLQRSRDRDDFLPGLENSFVGLGISTV